MNYRDNYGKDRLSVLGFGCMRFAKKGNGFDIEEIEKEIKYAVENGVNYFDTAYAYPGSEQVLGDILSRNNLRDKINIATKMPHYFMRTTKEAEDKFNEQLSRLKTDHIDYYLMHMLPDITTWEVLKQRGIDKWLEEKKESGKIRRIGFSYHGGPDKFKELLHAYTWDFCQIQYNYMDEFAQAGRDGLNEAAKLNIPVIIMEPLRGGRLAANLPKEAEAVFKESNRGWSNAEWSFRWLYNQSAVSVVLSGMNSMAMLKENIRIADECEVGSFEECDFSAIDKVKEIMNQKVKVPCTGCGYCMPCPAGVDIPGCFRCLNASSIDGYPVGVKEYLMCMGLKKNPALASICKECGACEKKCPQSIEIRKELKRVKKHFENPIFKLVLMILQKRQK